MPKKKTSLLRLDDPDAKDPLLGSPNDPEISESPMAVRRRRNARTVWCAIIALISGILIFIGVLTILRAVKDANNLTPKKRPEFPVQYEASLVVNMKYIDLVEPVYVHVDELQGLQKLSYYGDSNIYIFNTSGNSYQIIPVINELRCFQSDATPLQHVFPNMSLFEPQHGLTLIRGRYCLSWKYVTPGTGPTLDGWKGEYTLYVDQETEVPVQFHYIGRNPMLGGSHIDEYSIDYEYIRPGPIDPHVFTTLPSLMNCSAMPNEGNDTLSLRTPGNDIHMLMPEGKDAKERIFEEFKEKHGKVYADANEEQVRQLHFHHNLRYINAVNRKGLPYYLRMNPQGDLSYSERRNKLKRAQDNGATDIHQVSSANVKADIDWRTKGAVTPVKDQGSCGSCWTFGTTGALEGQIFMHSKTLYNLSQQSLMDCSWDYGNHACDGGFDYQAYKWIMDAGGIESSDTYGSYRNVPGYCHFNVSNAVARIKGFVNVTGMDALNDALTTVGPLSVSIDASLPSFYFYGGGYYDDVACQSDLDHLDHSVLAVGVITNQQGDKFTIVKNSWSVHWGEEGYIYIAQRNNICGVATAATYPLIET